MADRGAGTAAFTTDRAGEPARRRFVGRDGSPGLQGFGRKTRPPTATAAPIRFDATWDNGLFLKSDDDQFRFHAGGVGQIDSVWLIGPQGNFAAPAAACNGVGNAPATQLRRAILQVDGTIYDQFDYIIQFDFANASNDNSGVQPPSFGNLTSSPAPLNIWMQVRDVPYLGIVRVGNQTKPIGMTNNTPAPFLPFMERPDNHDAFYGPFDNGFALGIAALNWTESERVTWQYGIYRPATNVFGVALNKVVDRRPGHGTAGLRGRRRRAWSTSAWATWAANSCRTSCATGPGRCSATPPVSPSRSWRTPAKIPGSRQYTLGPEFAAVVGSLTVQAEWAGQFLTRRRSPTASRRARFSTTAATSRRCTS